MRADAGSGVAAPVKLNVAENAIIPVDNADSWVVGSDRMDRDAADATKDKRAFFNKVKGAFRAGSSVGTHWDDALVGTHSHAEGVNTTASGGSAHAEGSTTTASGGSAHAEGVGTTASGGAAHAEGNGCLASANQSHVEGWNSRAEGTASSAGGHNAKATRFGQWARAVGLWSPGEAQLCNMVASRATTNATPTALVSTPFNSVTLTGADTSVLTISVSRAFQLKISTVARRTDVQGEMAGFTWEGLVGRDSTGSARIIGTPIEAAWGDTPATDAWTLAVSIDTTDVTNNYVAVTATGEAGKTIRWVAKMEWVEVGG